MNLNYFCLVLIHSLQLRIQQLYGNRREDAVVQMSLIYVKIDLF